jgi:2,4-diaminopentanoate dehydrogenase
VSNACTGSVAGDAAATAADAGASTVRLSGVAVCVIARTLKSASAAAIVQRAERTDIARILLRHNPAMNIRVLLVGLGPIGAAIARQVVDRKGYQLVGAVDIDETKAGRDAGDVIELGRKLRVKVMSDVGKAIKATKPDVAVLCTSSSLKSVVGQFEAVLKHRVPIVTTTEEAAYPSRANRRLAARLDEAAKKAKVAVLGTGVNPGFAMDALPIALTAVCERVESVEVVRVQDARIRRLPFQQKIGAGMTKEQFYQQVSAGTVRHVGFTESIQMIADALGWKLDSITDDVKPKIAEATVASELLAVDAGYVSGIIQNGAGFVNGKPLITLRLEAYLGAPESYEQIVIEGSPRIHSRIDGGIHGDIATASIAINAIPAVIAATPGFRTMRDMRLPSFYGGR